METDGNKEVHRKEEEEGLRSGIQVGASQLTLKRKKKVCRPKFYRKFPFSDYISEGEQKLQVTEEGSGE